MTAISIHWRGESGKGSFDITESGYVASYGYMPDIFARVEPTRACILLANGEVDTAHPAGRPTLVGQYAVSVAGLTKVPWTDATIRFGCAEVVRLGEPTAWSPPREWTAYWLKDMPEDGAEVEKISDRLRGMSFEFDDTSYQNPEQSGSARVCQWGWAGNLAACMGIDQDRARIAAERFTDFQFRWRHAFFYDSAGHGLIAAEQPWWRVGPSGWDGAVKWTSDSPYKFEAVLQHLAPDRFMALAVGWSDFAARLYTDSYLEAVYTRPEFRAGTTADDQRTHGYCMRLAALAMLMDYGDAHELEGVVDGWRRANGFAPITGEPYASIAPAKPGKWAHGYPSLVDWTMYSAANKLELPDDVPPPTAGGTCDHLIGWLESQAIARGLPKQYYTFAHPFGLWQGHTIVWQTGVALGALCMIRDVPAAAALVPDIHKLIQHATACIVGPGMRPGLIGPTGTTLQPNPFHNSYHSRLPQRGMPGGGANGTATWLIHPLLAALQSLGPGLILDALKAAGDEWSLTTYPSPPDLQTSGPLPIRHYGSKT